MERRGWTVLVGTVLVAVLTAVSLMVKVPYVALGPGPTINTLGTTHGKKIITVVDGPDSTSKGQLRLVTVSVYQDLTLWDALRDWQDDRYAVVPREVIYPPGQTDKETNKQQEQQFQDSQSSAETAAYRELGCPVEVTVKSLPASSPSKGKLKPGDVITTVDGHRVTSAERLVQLVQAKKAGTKRTIGYRRGARAHTTTVTTKPSGSDGSPLLGVDITDKQPCRYKVKVKLGDIGGPSAGLMFALGIVDTLTPADLTAGRVIAGTGEITTDGTVKPIGGIQEKMIGAKNDGATVFLTPKANCAQAARTVPKGLRLVRVSTLHGAVKALADLRAHRKTPTC